MSAYIGLFFAAFIAATILPAQSEAVLVGLILTDRYSIALLVAVASVGNVLGSVLNWCLGRGVETYKDRSWFPIGKEKLERAQRWYGRYGKWSLLASWVPVIGDPITIAAGVMKEPLAVFVALVTLAKTTRYIVLAAAASGIL